MDRQITDHLSSDLVFVLNDVPLNSNIKHALQ